MKTLYVAAALTALTTLACTGEGGEGASSEGASSEDASSEEATSVSSPSSSDSDSSDSSETSTDGAGGGFDECEQDEDCELASDCCGCSAWPVGESPDVCNMGCDVDVCTAVGITGAWCELGKCVPASTIICDTDFLECEEEPPACASGLPSLTQGGCWTGECVPVSLCQSVPDCSFCTADEICVEQFLDSIQMGAPTYCLPLPPACEGVANCACADFVCDLGGFTSCSEIEDGIFCGF